jgi:hypothetical protein
MEVFQSIAGSPQVIKFENGLSMKKTSGWLMISWISSKKIWGIWSTYDDYRELVGGLTTIYRGLTWFNHQ